MNRFAPPRRGRLVLPLVLVGTWLGCGPGTEGGGGAGSGGKPAGQATGGAAGIPASGGNAASSGGGSGSGGAPSTSGGASGTGGATGSGGSSATGATGGAASGGAGGKGGNGGLLASGGAGGRSTGSGGAIGSGGATGSGGANNCMLPATVSYQKDVQAFLIRSCGGGNGCHVIDTMSTVASGGFNHGYDWITAGAHATSCPNVPKRFEVVLDVIKQANPASCSKSRKMPPPDATGAGVRDPLTPCEVAALQAWLNEPLVVQMHRADDSSPTTPYPMPPFN